MNPQNHNFILKENGLIYWVKDMPENQIHSHDSNYLYAQELQSAIDNAVEVSNQEEVLERLHGVAYPQDVKNGAVYSLLCSVEIKQGGETNFFPTGIQNHTYPVALVTFPESGEKQSQEETQELLWKEMQDLYRSVRDMHGIQYVTPALMSKFTITRK
jgi:hypothetical protein